MKRGMILTALVVALGLSLPTETFAADVNLNRDMLAQQDDVKYEKIDVTELPDAVNQAVTADYAGHEIAKASKGDDGTYKVKLKSDDGKTTVIYNADGEFVSTEEDKEDDGLFDNDDADDGSLFDNDNSGETDDQTTPPSTY